MRRTLIISITALFLSYFLSYIWLRQTHAEVWEKDNQTYVIFPDDKVFLYYIYRPLSYGDGNLTGMRFHIGQHR